MKDNQQQYSIAVHLNSEGKAPKSIQLLPSGEMVGRDGRPFNNASPEQIIAAFHSLGRDVSIDYEHAADLVKGEPIPAAGWISRMEVKNGEIWGDVEWTPKASQMIEDKEYRFLSPAIYYNSHDDTVLEIFGAALTNRPNLKLAALNKTQSHTSQSKTENNAMDKQTRVALCKSLGLADEASDASILAATERLKEDKVAALNKAQTPDATKYVPIADYDLVKGNLATALNTINEQSTQTAEAAIDDAIKAGKVAPSSKAYHLNSCKTPEGLEGFKAMVAAAPSINGDGKGDNLDADVGGKTKALNSEQRTILTDLGINMDDEKAVAEAVAEMGD